MWFMYNLVNSFWLKGFIIYVNKIGEDAMIIERLNKKESKKAFSAVMPIILKVNIVSTSFVPHPPMDRGISGARKIMGDSKK